MKLETKPSMEAFTAIIKSRIKSYLPDTYQMAEITVQPIKKQTIEYTGLSIVRPGIPYSPVLNLEGLYDMLEENDIESILEKIAEVVQDQSPEVSISEITEMIENYEVAKHNLFVRLNSAKAPGYYDSMPHKAVEDLVMTCNISHEDFSAAITNEMLEKWNVSEEQLFEDAMENSPKIMPYRADDLGSMFGHSSGPKVTVLTNKTGNYGASAMLYPGVLDELSEGEKVYIIPSSVHEVLICHDDVPLSKLKSMVTMANSSVVAKDQKLSDNVYVYENGKLSTAV